MNADPSARNSHGPNDNSKDIYAFIMSYFFAFLTSFGLGVSFRLASGKLRFMAAASTLL